MSSRDIILRMKLGRWRNLLIIFVLCIVFLISAFQIVYTQEYADTDFFSFWLSGYSILNGEDPYSQNWWIYGHEQFGANWISDPTFLYPLPLGILFAPLGFFTLDHAFVFWVFLSQLLILVSAILLITYSKQKNVHKYLLPILAGIFLFRPVILTLLQGQLGALFLLLLVLIIILWDNDKWLAGGILLPFIALKPSFGILIFSMIALWLLIQRKWEALGGALISSLCLFFLAWIFNPRWLTNFITIGSGKLSDTFGYSPTIWGISFYICGYQNPCSLILGGIICGLLLFATFYFFFSNRVNRFPAFIMSLIIPIVLLVTPYGWAYDQILLIIPIIIVIVVMIKNELPYLISASMFLMISLISLLLVQVAMKIEYDMWSAAVPLFTGLLVLICIFLGRRIPEAP